MSSGKVLKRRIVEDAAADFAVSDSLSKFLPATTEFSIGVQTEWFKGTPRTKSNEDRDEKPRPSSGREK